MNDVLAADGHAGRRRLRARTFKVIPLSPRVGLCEWVHNAPVLKAPLESGFGGGDERRGRHLLTNACRARDKVLKARSDRNDYLAKAYAASPSRAGRAYDAALAVLAPGSACLRRHLAAIAPRAETRVSRRGRTKVPLERSGAGARAPPRDTRALGARALSRYLATRRTYAKSLAVTSVFGYVCGVGDRHLQNLLLSSDDGAVVHIDFGYSFGTGSGCLPIPELIPFRLTRELLAPLAPLNAETLVATYGETAMGALREPRSRAALLALLETFVREPVIDWLKGKAPDDASQLLSEEAAVNANAPPTEVTASQRMPPRGAKTMSPQHRVDAARAKLFGANPVDILCRDLDQNPMLDSKVLERVKDVARGDDDALRRKKPDPILDVHDQVAVLMDLATDPNTLGRQYAGLMLWC